MNVRTGHEIVLCPVCTVETMPLKSTGKCAFCDTLLLPDTIADLSAPEFAYTPNCLWCDKELPASPGRERKFCGRTCQNMHWEKYTEAGRACRLARYERQKIKKREKRWAEKAARAA